MSGDPVSWLLIEPGWTVYDANGEKVGKVKEVLADEQADIFHGVLVERGLRRRGGDRRRPDRADPRGRPPPRVAGRFAGAAPRQPCAHAAIRCNARRADRASPNGPQHSRKPTKSGPNPFVVAGAAFGVGTLLAKLIDWRGHAHPRR